MRVYIYGYDGNMARRYRAILAQLGHYAGGEDMGRNYGFSLNAADAVIVATPTDTHVDVLRRAKDCGKPILCEKPLTKSMDELEATLEAMRASCTQLRMVSQYDYLVEDFGNGPTVYDYFKSGSDGLLWDCINVVKHARGPIALRNESPIWQCMINGQALDIADMDHAYVEMIDDWLRDPLETNPEAIWRAHKKVHDLEAQLKWRAS